MTKIPRNQTPVARILTGGHVDFGSSVPIHFDGAHSFSIALWVCVDTPGATGVLLRRGDEIVLGLDRGQPYVKLKGQPDAARAEFTLSPNWHFMLLTYASDGPNSGTFRFLIDGTLKGETIVSGVGSPVSGQPLLLGEGVAMSVRWLALYSSSLSGERTQTRWVPDTTSADLIASYCFNRVPANDPKGNPITFRTNASQQILTPALDFTGHSWASGAASDGVNPGGAGNDPYTLQAWVWVEAATTNPERQRIFSTGKSGAGVDLAVKVNNSTQKADVSAAHGSTVINAGSFALRQWHNVAVTYDGTKLITYVDGVAAGELAAPAIPSIPVDVPFFGAERTGGVPALDGFFQGSTQSVDVWNRALPAADIVKSMSATPYDAAGCVASYDFSSFPANAIHHSSVSVFGGASYGERFFPPPSNTAELEAAVAAARVQPAAARQYSGPLPALPLVEIAGAMRKRLSDDAAEQLRGLIPPAQRDAILAEMEGSVDDVNEALRTTGRPLPGTIQFVREGDEWVYVVHEAEGPIEVLRVPAEEFDACTVWRVDVTASIICGVMTIIGVPMSSARVSRILLRLLRSNRALTQALVAVLQEELTARTIQRVLRWLFASVSLGAFVTDILADFSWWDALFISAAIVLAVIEICFPNPSSPGYYVLFIAKAGIAAAQITVALAQKPSGC